MAAPVCLRARRLLIQRHASVIIPDVLDLFVLLQIIEQRLELLAIRIRLDGCFPTYVGVAHTSNSSGGRHTTKRLGVWLLTVASNEICVAAVAQQYIIQRDHNGNKPISI